MLGLGYQAGWDWTTPFLISPPWKDSPSQTENNRSMVLQLSHIPFRLLFSHSLNHSHRKNFHPHLICSAFKPRFQNVVKSISGKPQAMKIYTRGWWWVQQYWKPKSCSYQNSSQVRLRRSEELCLCLALAVSAPRTADVWDFYPMLTQVGLTGDEKAIICIFMKKSLFLCCFSLT